MERVVLLADALTESRAWVPRKLKVHDPVICQSAGKYWVWSGKGAPMVSIQSGLASVAVIARKNKQYSRASFGCNYV